MRCHPLKTSVFFHFLGFFGELVRLLNDSRQSIDWVLVKMRKALSLVTLYNPTRSGYICEFLQGGQLEFPDESTKRAERPEGESQKGRSLTPWGD